MPRKYKFVSACLPGILTPQFRKKLLNFFKNRRGILPQMKYIEIVPSVVEFHIRSLTQYFTL
jgi:hypothetical protein